MDNSSTYSRRRHKKTKERERHGRIGTQGPQCDNMGWKMRFFIVLSWKQVPGWSFFLSEKNLVSFK